MGTIDEKFIKDNIAGRGVAVILAGSDSDQKHIDNIVPELETYGIAYRVHIASAHKQPEQVEKIIDMYNTDGRNLVYIAVAGGTDALSGMVSFHADHPVISCPPEGAVKVVNASCLTNPPGSSNAYILRPANAARFVAQMFSHCNPDVRDKLKELRDGKITTLKEKGNEFTIAYARREVGDD